MSTWMLKDSSIMAEAHKNFNFTLITSQMQEYFAKTEKFFYRCHKFRILMLALQKIYDQATRLGAHVSAAIYVARQQTKAIKIPARMAKQQEKQKSKNKNKQM